MPKIVKPLSDAECRHHKFRGKGHKDNRLRDGGGLYLEALATGRKVWRLEYKTGRGTKSRASLEHDYGTREGTLTKARQWREATRELLAQGIDPNQYAEQERQRREAAHRATFDAVADEWLEHKAANWSPAQAHKVRGIIKRVLLPWIGKRPIADIQPNEILHCIQKYEQAGKLESAHRAREYASAIFRRAILHGLTQNDPAGMLKGVLRPIPRKNYAHLTDPEAIGGLLRAIDGLEGTVVVTTAVKLSPIVFVRPGELRSARWQEMDLAAGAWNIPAERMKSRRPHSVPLASQAVELLKALEPFTHHVPENFVFPSIRSALAPMSENTVNACLRRMGYSNDQQTAHGFRHMASTRLHEMGWPSHVIETQLAHKDKNDIRAVYNKAEYWVERVKMMQAWADYLDSLKAGNNKVSPIRKASAISA